MIQETFNPKMKQLEAELEKAYAKEDQITLSLPKAVTIKGLNPYQSLYEYTSARLEISRIEKRILNLERDSLWWENFHLKDAGSFDQQPGDWQPPSKNSTLVYLTDNVIQFPPQRRFS